MVVRSSNQSSNDVAVIGIEGSSAVSTTDAAADSVPRTTGITLVVASLTDAASFNPAKALLSRGGWQEMGPVEVGQLIAWGGCA